jgi:hypothetical protein
MRFRVFHARPGSVGGSPADQTAAGLNRGGTGSNHRPARRPRPHWLRLVARFIAAEAPSYPDLPTKPQSRSAGHHGSARRLKLIGRSQPSSRPRGPGRAGYPRTYPNASPTNSPPVTTAVATKMENMISSLIVTASPALDPRPAAPGPVSGPGGWPQHPTQEDAAARMIARRAWKRPWPMEATARELTQKKSRRGECGPSY